MSVESSSSPLYEEALELYSGALTRDFTYVDAEVHEDESYKPELEEVGRYFDDMTLSSEERKFVDQAFIDAVRHIHHAIDGVGDSIARIPYQSSTFSESLTHGFVGRWHEIRKVGSHRRTTESREMFYDALDFGISKKPVHACWQHARTIIAKESKQEDGNDQETDR